MSRAFEAKGRQAVAELLAARGWPARVGPPGGVGQRWHAPRLLGGVVLGEPPGPAPQVRRFLRDGFRYTPFVARRPAQWLLGTAWARAPLWRPPLATAVMCIDPPLPAARWLLWLPLLRKVRLFDFSRGLCWIQLRPDADRPGFEREVALRRGGPGPWPPLLQADPAAGRSVEPLLEGFVLARAPAHVDVRGALREAFERLERWNAASERVVAAADYVGGLLGEVERAAARLSGAVNPSDLARIQQVAQMLRADAEQGTVCLRVAHGDMQLGNIFFERRTRRVWLIDWEHHGERQVGHDRLVLGLRSRSGGRTVPRLLAFLAGSRAFPFEPFESFRAARRAVAARFLLEELRFHLQESMVGDRALPSAGLVRYLRAAPGWAGLLGKVA